MAHSINITTAVRTFALQCFDRPEAELLIDVPAPASTAFKCWLNLLHELCVSACQLGVCSSRAVCSFVIISI